MTTPRILYFNRAFCLDQTNGATVASLALLRALARRGFSVSVFSGTTVDAGPDLEIASLLESLHISAESFELDPIEVDSPLPPPRRVSVLRFSDRGVSVTLPHRRLRMHDDPDPEADEVLLELAKQYLKKTHFDILLTYGGDGLTLEVLDIARQREVATAFTLHNFLYRDPRPMLSADAIIVPSHFAERYYRLSYGLTSIPLPNVIDIARVKCNVTKPEYLTFVNPSIEKGVFAFARIADELGRRRPDIRILVVEGRGTEETVAACGLELREHGNMFFLSNTPDPRQFWGVTKACLLPSLWWENQPLVAIEAMVNGIPVIASDRGGIPETLGGAGIVLPLPDRMTEATRLLPTREEVGPWVATIIRLWDDESYYQEHRSRALAEARRWDPDTSERRYDQFFRGLAHGQRSDPAVSEGRGSTVVLVAHRGRIHWDCERSLRMLEAEGILVIRHEGGAQTDVTRNRLATESLHEGFDSIFFIDADVLFDPADAMRLIARTESVVAGVCADPDLGSLDGVFADGLGHIEFGDHVTGFYPLKYASTSFMRVKASAFRKIVDGLGLPLCDQGSGSGFWPFFQSTVIPVGREGYSYLRGDWSFSNRLSSVGITPMADTSLHLRRAGRRLINWKDVMTAPRDSGLSRDGGS